MAAPDSGDDGDNAGRRGCGYGGSSSQAVWGGAVRRSAKRRWQRRGEAGMAAVFRPRLDHRHDGGDAC
jgi:hypothetical protein